MRRILWLLAVVLILASAGLLMAPNARERHLTNRVAAVGGTYGVTYVGPAWLPDAVVRWRLFCRPSHIYLSETTASDSDLESLSGMTGITHIDLTDTKISDDGLEKLANLPNLEKLILTGTEVSDAGLPHLMKSTRPQILVLKETRITDAGLSTIGQMTWLACLDLGGTQVTDEGLAQLKGLVNLQTLTLKNTRISDVGLFLRESSKGSERNGIEPDGRADLSPWLRSMKNLDYLDVRGTKVTAGGLKRLRRAFPRKQVLPEEEIAPIDSSRASVDSTPAGSRPAAERAQR
jgi:Leucine-rich repeat (LRR) protein